MGSLKSDGHRAGWLYFGFALLAVVNNFFVSAGFFVPGDPAATARNITARELGFRVGITLSFAELIFFVVVVVALFGLFAAVDRKLAILMVSFVNLGVAVSLSNLVLKTAPLYYLGGADYLSAFSGPQLEALSQVFMNLRGSGSNIAIGFWGLWLVPLGLLVIRSGFVPKWVGWLVLAAGLAYCTNSIVALVAPDVRAAVSRVLMPLQFGELAIIFWLMIRGARETPAAAPTTAERASAS